MVFEMIKDLYSFLAVFVSVALGFGIAFHSLFPHLPDGTILLLLFVCLSVCLFVCLSVCLSVTIKLLCYF